MYAMCLSLRKDVVVSMGCVLCGGGSGGGVDVVVDVDVDVVVVQILPAAPSPPPPSPPQPPRNTTTMVNYDELQVDNNHTTDGVNVGEFLEGLDGKRRANLDLVPTDDAGVKAMLRHIGEPVTRFGESAGDRRTRLLGLIAERNLEVSALADDDVEMDGGEDGGEADDDDVPDEEFYTPASEELVEARRFIARDALGRSQLRLDALRLQGEVPFEEVLLGRRSQNELCKRYGLVGSQLISTRPVSMVAISPLDSDRVLTGSWGGDVKLLNGELEVLKTFDTTASLGKVGGLAWSPADESIFACTGANVQLWNAESTEAPLMELTNHTNRVVRCQFHPSGRFIASASFDMTWRLWDINTQQELLLQEGHSKEVYTVRFHPDGSLLASAGLDGVGLVWDLRLGQMIMPLKGHIKPIYGLDWSANGVNVATSSADGSIKVWDLRMQRELETIAAHSKVVSDVKFHKNQLISSSYDNTLKIFSCDNWLPLTTLEGHSEKVMSFDVCDDYILSTGWDRSAKKWVVDG